MTTDRLNKNNQSQHALVLYSHVGMQDKVVGGEAEGKVVGRDLGLLGVEGDLVAGQPSLVAKDGGGVDQRTSQVQVHVRVEVHVVVGVLGLDAATLVARLGREGAVQRQLQSLDQLVLKSDLGGQGVVRVPLLVEGQAVLLDLVLGLEAAEDLARVLVRVSGCGELDSGVGLGLDVQLPQTKVVSLAEQVAGLLAQIRVRRRSHLDREGRGEKNGKAGSYLLAQLLCLSGYDAHLVTFHGCAHT